MDFDRIIRECGLSEDVCETLRKLHAKKESFSGELESLFESYDRGDEAFGKSISAFAKSEGVACCDVYYFWKTLENGGVDTTELLANKLNHHSREMHYYMAIKLIETIFQ